MQDSKFWLTINYRNHSDDGPVLCTAVDVEENFRPSTKSQKTKGFLRGGLWN